MNLDAVGLLAATKGLDPADGFPEPGSPAVRRPIAAKLFLDAAKFVKAPGPLQCKRQHSADLG